VSTYALVMGLAGWIRSPMVCVVPAVVVAGTAGVLWWRRWGTPRNRGSTGEAPGHAEERPSPAGGQRKDLPEDEPRSDSPGDFGPGWLWLAVPFGLILVLGGMLPPVDFDVLEYHLQAPKEWYRQGQITFMPHNVYANMPAGAGMLALLAMNLTGDWWVGALAGKTVVAVLPLVTALGLGAAGQESPFFQAAP